MINVQGRILLHFDGWEIDYDYWTKPSSMNVKPVGWCAANRKQLNPPKVGRIDWVAYWQTILGFHFNREKETCALCSA